MPSSSMADTPSQTGTKPALDDVMMAMDVVDTLRHHESVALNELEQDGRDDVLKERLRQIYESQGLAVSDRILDEGIRALKESRFAYEPTPSGFSRTLAGLWIKRGNVGKTLAALVVAVTSWTGWTSWRDAETHKQAEAARIEISETLPRQLETTAKATLDQARTNGARERATQLEADGSTALARSDASAAKVAISDLERLRAELVRTYQLRIIARPGEDSGIFRIPDVNRGTRNYYLIVEAVAPNGEVLSLPIRNEETGRTKTVSRWGIRVPQQTFDAVRRDKQDDGNVQNNILGEKPRGALEPTYAMAISGGAITEW